MIIDRVTIEQLFAALNTELAEQDTHASMFVFGGAAIILTTDRERVTQDIDAVFQPVPEVRAAISAVAQQHNLSEDWLNDAGKGYLNPEWTAAGEIMWQGSHLRIMCASPRQLLAMKVAAARTERDSADIVSLARACHVSTVEEILSLAEEELGVLAPYLLTARSQFLIENLFGIG